MLRSLIRVTDTGQYARNFRLCFLVTESDPGSELLVRLAEVHYAFDQADKGRDARPAEKEVKDALSDLSHVELMNTEASKEESQDAGGDFTFISCSHSINNYSVAK